MLRCALLALTWHCCSCVQIRFDLDRVLAYVQRRLELRGHVVLCMSEGAGQVSWKQRSGAVER